MPQPMRNACESVDSATSRAIAIAIGQKLRQSVAAETALPHRLEQLLAELRRKDSES